MIISLSLIGMQQEAYAQVNQPPSFVESTLPHVIVIATGEQTDIRLQLTPPVAIDPEDGPVTVRLLGLSSYPTATHTITWYATDSGGRFAQIFQTVTIIEPSGLTQERLAALIEVRNLALDQQNLQIDYWSDPTNPFADNRTMAQKQLNNANYHISITTAQRDSYQTELDGLTG